MTFFIFYRHDLTTRNLSHTYKRMCIYSGRILKRPCQGAVACVLDYREIKAEKLLCITH